MYVNVRVCVRLDAAGQERNRKLKEEDMGDERRDMKGDGTKREKLRFRENYKCSSGS